MILLVIYRMNKDNISVIIVLLILICINIVGLFVVKDSWVEGNSQGWEEQVSKVLYGAVLVIMLPSLLLHFDKLSSIKWIILLWFVYYFCAYLNGFKNYDLGFNLKYLLFFVSLPYFSVKFNKTPIVQKLINVLIFSVSINILHSVLMADVLSSIVRTGDARTGQATSIGVIFLIPLVFHMWKAKYASYFYLFALTVCFISMRRTSILVCLFCFPFIYKYIRSSLSTKQLIYIMCGLLLLSTFAIFKYKDAIMLRFSDMFTANEDGQYGSGRTGWYKILIYDYIGCNDLLVYLFGFGHSHVAAQISKMGYSFNHAHNDYIEILCTYGLVGINSLYYFIISRIRKVAFLEGNNKKLVYMALAQLLLIGAVSGIILNPVVIMFSIYLGIIINEHSRNLKDKVIWSKFQ